MGFATHGLLVSSMILRFYECPKNDGRRRLCERQRRASPKRRDRIIIKPMIALSADAVIWSIPVIVSPEPSPVRD